MNRALRIMLVGGNAREAEEIRQAVTSAGFSSDLETLHFQEEFSLSMENHRPDIIVNRLNHSELPLEVIAKSALACDPPPAIVSIDATGDYSATDCMAAGACDLVQSSQPGHLGAVIRRTARAQATLYRYTALQEEYDELKIRCTTLLNTSEHPIAYLHDGIHVSANPAYYQLFGLSTNADLLGIPLMDLVDATSQTTLKTYLKEQKKQHGSNTVLDTTLCINNEDIPVSLSCAEVQYEGEMCTQLMIRRSPQDDTAALTDQLDYLAIYDISSGLYTRHYLLEQIDQILQLPATQESERGSGLILLSIDNYAALASALGHVKAELLYAEIGAALKGYLSLDDLLCRFDTSTFGLLTTNLSDAEQDELVRQMLSHINDHPFQLDDRAIPCRLSAGMTMLDGHTTDTLTVIAEVEHTLRDANQQGRDLSISGAGKQGENQRVIDALWAERLRTALTEDYFKLVFQPVLKLKGDGIQRYSVSIHIDDPKDGCIAPAEFLPSAERTGYAKGIDRWVIMNTLEMMRYQQEATSDEPEFIIRLTNDMLAHDNDLNWIGHHIDESGVHPHRLIFQLNAVSLIQNLDNVQQLIDDLKPIGCKFSVSEFGNTVNPFQALKHLELDYLSLDPTLTEDIDYHPEHCEQIHQLCQQAHELGLKIMARKITGGPQLFKVKDLGVDFIQGDILQQPSETLQYDFSLLA